MSNDGLITAQANSTLDSILAAFPWIQLHTGFPGAAGTSNVAVNSTRQSAAYASASSASKASNADLVWTSVPAAETYTHFTAWSASSAGTCGFTGSVTAPAVAIGDTFKIQSGALTASFPAAA